MDTHEQPDVLKRYLAQLGQGAPDVAESLVRMHARIADAASAGMAYRQDAENGVTKDQYSDYTLRNDSRKWGVFSGYSLRRWVGYGFVAGVAALLSFNLLQNRVPMSPEPVTPTYTTAPGQRANITLKDGTQIILNVASRIHVPEDYGVMSRVIDLDGEAQFTVKHDAKRPFLVRANGTIVRDLSTTFVVRAYHGAPTMRVAVSDGKVSVQPPVISATEAITVNAGNIAAVDATSKTTIHPIERGEEYFAWIQGRLVLKAVPLSEALTDLGRWYGIDFRVADSSMLLMDVSGVFPQSLTDERLHAIADILGAKVQRSGATVIFHRIVR